MHSPLSHFRIAGIAVTTGSITRDFFADGKAQGINQETLDRLSRTIGFKTRKVAGPKITALDLCEEATHRLLDEMSIDCSSIDAVIFVTQTPDHSQPNNASLLHGRLGLNKSAIAFDLSLGCSGWVYGLHQAGLLCAHAGFGRVLLCAGDTLSRLTNPHDRAIDPIFGDAGSVTLIEKTGDHSVTHFVLGADGKGSSSVIVPAGGARRPASAETRQEVKEPDGNLRHAENLQMDGAEVFNFTLREVPHAIQAVMKSANFNASDCEALVLHQANRFIVETLASKCGFKPHQVPASTFTKFGNQSSASIPAVMCDALADTLRQKSVKIVGCGFGVGLSWAAFAGEMGPVVVLPIQSYPASDES